MGGSPKSKLLEKTTLWLCQNSYWEWPFIVSFPIKIVIFFSYVSLPEGNLYGNAGKQQKIAQDTASWGANRCKMLPVFAHQSRAQSYQLQAVNTLRLKQLEDAAGGHYSSFGL